MTVTRRRGNKPTDIIGKEAAMAKFSGYLIGTDFDGTLSRDGTVTERDREALRYFRGEGGIFGIVTGRSYSNSYGPFLDCLGGGFDFVICQNGGAAFDPSGEFVFRHSFPSRSVLPVYEYAKSNGLGALCCCSDRDFFSVNLSDSPSDGKTDISDILKLGRIDQMIAIPDTFPVRRAADELEAIADGRFGVFRNHRSIDMPPPGITKATGLGEIAGLFGIDEGMIYTAGDNWNDLPMIAAFHGYAVENAEDDVKKAAEIIVPDIAAIVEYIEKTDAAEHPENKTMPTEAAERSFL